MNKATVNPPKQPMHHQLTNLAPNMEAKIESMAENGSNFFVNRRKAYGRRDGGENGCVSVKMV